jgi:hypothetical protein
MLSPLRARPARPGTGTPRAARPLRTARGRHSRPLVRLVLSVTLHRISSCLPDELHRHVHHLSIITHLALRLTRTEMPSHRRRAASVPFTPGSRKGQAGGGSELLSGGLVPGGPGQLRENRACSGRSLAFAVAALTAAGARPAGRPPATRQAGDRARPSKCCDRRFVPGRERPSSRRRAGRADARGVVRAPAVTERLYSAAGAGGERGNRPIAGNVPREHEARPWP